MLEKISNDIEKIIIKNCELEESSIDRDCKLEELNIDSISFIKIIVAVEEKYDIEVPMDMLSISALGSINKFADTILKLKEG